MDDGPNDATRSYVARSYALSGKIMLSAIVILFTVVLLIFFLHIYARWFLTRSRRRHNTRHGRPRTHLVFTSSDPAASANTVSAPSPGLDASVLKAIPTFVYSSATHDQVLECAVCLSEFEENEKGRLLPRCKHSFHIDCIDMWFHSHSTCPLCRAPVNPEIESPPRKIEAAVDVEVVISVGVGEPPETQVVPSTGRCPECRYHENEMNRMPSSTNSSSPSAAADSSSSSLGNRRKPFELVGVSIEVPRRNNEAFRGMMEEEVGVDSPGGGQGFKSPGSRILSLKMILSRDRRAALSPSSAAIVQSCNSSVTESNDLERSEEGQQRPR
ncbi:PREDICTED: RING-H2 finger protein ATL2-like [Nelumbo nucifera]|uniref:RING-type E3 ubiquitin transferase n=2 Tax=Nelumbo nucifera TaxID=4432 RepID=A0A822Z033_NELNU|nr:PREDICTED: RING-H2 finger protein ATL2-like [Nelumbo nucifera]DAD38127.1 TPA_asm: hypothetical protein HUJ06_008768 [Nelumbo nucifera]